MFGYFRTKIVRRNWFVVAACCVAPSGILAQTVPVEKLKPSNAILREEFTSLSTRPIRELADGRVLISETAAASRLIVADFKSGVVEAIGRKGAGPGEFTAGIGLHALSHDSTVFVTGESRWLILAGSKIVQTTARPHNTVSLEQGFDTAGSFLGFLPAASNHDSSRRAVVSRKTNKITAVFALASYAEAGYPPAPKVSASGRTSYSRGAWIGGEGAQLFPDGWIAVARVEPYRVDWLSPSGTWNKGAPLPEHRIAVNQREKNALLNREAELHGSSWVPAMWPKRIPAFIANSTLLATPDGKLLIPRTPTADHPETLYDVVNRLGKLERQIDLGEADRILGFGVKSVYVSTIDGDGIQRISRHPWP